MVSGQIDFVRRYLATLQKYLALKKASFGRVLTRGRQVTSQEPELLAQGVFKNLFIVWTQASLFFTRTGGSAQ